MGALTEESKIGSLAREARAGSQEARLALIEAYNPLIFGLIRRYRGILDKGDIAAYAVLELLEAVESFDPDIGFTAGYGTDRIRGRILDECRKVKRTTHLGHSPRTLYNGNDFRDVDNKDEVEYLLGNSGLTDRERMVIEHRHLIVVPRPQPVTTQGHVAGMTYKELRELLRPGNPVSKSVVGGLESRALQKMLEKAREAA